MSLVYVHGIGNRPGREYDRAEAERNRMFRRFLVPAVFGPDVDVPIRSPLWGEDGARLRAAHASLPGDGLESLGGPAVGTATADALTVADPPVSPHAALVQVARRSLADAVDLAFSLALPSDGTADDDGMVSLAADIVAYSAYRESLYPAGPETVRYPWLAGVVDDLDLVDQLRAQVVQWRSSTAPALSAAAPARPTVEVLGGSDPAGARLRDGVRRLRQTLADRHSAPVVAAMRRLVAPKITLLLGDVLAYLAQRGTPDQPGTIVRTVAEALDEAAGDPGPRVVIAHSMGGNIVYDVLSHFRPDLHIDLLVTVGSQVGLFQELQLFPGNTGAGPTGRDAAPMPANIGRWLNVVDLADMLSYRVAPVIAGVEDYVYPSGALWAHTAYLRQPHFHARLAGRAREALETRGA